MAKFAVCLPLGGRICNLHPLVLTTPVPGETWQLWLGALEELLGDVGGILGARLMGNCSLSG